MISGGREENTWDFPDDETAESCVAEELDEYCPFCDVRVCDQSCGLFDEVHGGLSVMWISMERTRA